jgi:hypothetical protein
MTSQSSSFFISLLLILIGHFVGHSFQSNVLLSNNIFCFIEFPNKSHFSDVTCILTIMPFPLILNNPLAMLHLIFQTIVPLSQLLWK